MTLFSLLAKLTLDSTQFNQALEEAQSEAESFDMPDDHSLELDNSEFNDALDESEAKGESFGSKIGEVFKELKGVIVATGVVALVGQIVGTLKEGVNLARQHGDQIDKQSQKLHLSAQAYQELDYALKLSGASIDDLTRAMRTFDEIQGGKITTEQADYFGKLGISATDASGKIKSAQQLMEETMYALADYSGSDRGLMMEAFFGKNSAGLNAFLNQTSDQIKDMRREANDLGLIMTDEEVKNAAAYNDAVTRLDSSLNALKESFVSGILPIITEAVNGVAKLVALFNWRAGDNNSIGDTFDQIDKEGANALKTLEKNEAQAESLIDKLASMGDYWTLDDTGKKTWDALARELVALFPELDEVISNNKNAITENTDAIKENVKQWAELEKQRILSNTVAEKREAIAQKYAEALDKEVEAELKETRVAGDRKEFMKELNSLMRSGDLQELAENANFSDIQKATQQLYSNARDDYSMVQRINNVTGTEYYQAMAQAAALRSEAAKATEEADTKSAELDDYIAKLGEKLGTATSEAESAKKAVEELDSALSMLPEHKQITIDIASSGDGFPSAKGAWTIPYDNYPILAHRGERLLTASQARHGEGLSDAGAIVSAIQGMRNDLQNMKLVVGRKTFGRTVVQYGGNRMDDFIGESESRSAAGYGT